MSNKLPADYAEGWGELIRAHRIYIGISQRTLAGKLKMSERSLSDIEVGRRACPPGFLNAVQDIAQEFYGDVRQVMNVAESGLEAHTGDDDYWFTITVHTDPAKEWQRAVISRAAVENGNIMPVLSAT